jgi:hypothetical protein
MKKLKTLVGLLILLFAASCAAQDVEIENVPDEALKDVELGTFAKTYVLNGAMNPFYLRGDFDGDKKTDYAFWIRDKSTGEVGIAIWLTSRRNIVVIGAGAQFSISGKKVTNLNFVNTWKVFERKSVERAPEAAAPPKLVGDAILAGKSGSASGLIYWDGRAFLWYQQGD